MYRCLFSPLALAILATSSQAATVRTTIDPAKCQELVEASVQAGTDLRAAGLAAAEQIDAGGELKEEACLDDLRDFDFDFFSNITSMKGAMIKRIKDEAIEALKNMSCDAANEVINAANTYLTCSASVGVTLSAGAGFNDIDASECMGRGGALNYQYDAGQYEVGGSEYGISPSEGVNTSTTNNNSRSTNSEGQGNSTNEPTNSTWDRWRP